MHQTVVSVIAVHIAPSNFVAKLKVDNIRTILFFLKTLYMEYVLNVS